MKQGAKLQRLLVTGFAGVMKMGKQRFQKRFEFWLDMWKPEEETLGDTIDDLKEKRLFAPTIRDGIRLVCDLRQGRIDVLLELFPWVQDTLCSNDDQLKRIEELLLQQQIGGGSGLLMKARQVEPEPELVVNKARGEGNSAQNFLNSMSSLLG